MTLTNIFTWTWILVLLPAVHSLNLEAKDFEHCTFNLVSINNVTNSGRSTSDVEEGILLDNRGYQRWTVASQRSNDTISTDNLGQYTRIIVFESQYTFISF